MASRRNEQNFHDNLPQPVYDLIASFQRTAIEMLFDKASRAAELRHPRSVLVSGGVACNSLLRDRFREGFAKKNIPVHFPSPILSTDNAAMIAAAGYPKLMAGQYADLSLNADVHLKLHRSTVIMIGQMFSSHIALKLSSLALFHALLAGCLFSRGQRYEDFVTKNALA